MKTYITSQITLEYRPLRVQSDGDWDDSYHLIETQCMLDLPSYKMLENDPGKEARDSKEPIPAARQKGRPCARKRSLREIQLTLDLI